MKKLNLIATSVACVIGVALTACGGGSSGGGGGTDTPTTSSITTQSPAAVAPAIGTQPLAQSVVIGHAAVFSVEATGTEPLTYQWKKNSSDIAGATSSTYTTPVIGSGDNGAVFTVLVSNSVGTVTSNNAVLTVSTAPVAPAIGTQPLAQSVATGQAATFSVAATGTGPFTYQWKKNGSDIAGATSSTYTTPAIGSGDNGAQFSVVVSNSAGKVTSSNAVLTVSTSTAAVAPAIGTQPLTQSVATGQAATFSVVATGTGPFTYQWKKNGSDIAGATSSTYTTPAIGSGDNGAQFSVVVSNSAGKVTSSNAVLSDVAIGTQPSAQSATTSKTATFSVVATGTGPFTYQWKKNGNNIDGATTSTYTTPATSIGDNNALYSVVVSNSAGTVSSSTATLSVLAPRYTLVPKTGGMYDKTECVKDSITGLVWEGKNPGGSSSRLSTSTYTNYEGTGIGQKPDGSNATQAEVNAITNSIGYVHSVNSSGLCGFTDWRLPTKAELQGIVVSGPGPTIDSEWFPNTQPHGYWTSSPYKEFLFSAWFIGFGYGNTDNNDRSNSSFHVRLVR